MVALKIASGNPFSGRGKKEMTMINAIRQPTFVPQSTKDIGTSEGDQYGGLLERKILHQLLSP